MDPIMLQLSAPEPDEVQAIAERYAYEQRVLDGDDSIIEARFETVLHSLAFADAAADLAWFSVGRPPLDADGWEMWTDAGPNQREVGAPLLPAEFDAGATQVFRYEYAWIEDPSGRPNTRLGRELGLRSAVANKAWLWRAVKMGYRAVGAVWKVARTWQFVVAQHGAGLLWREIQQQAMREQVFLDVLEAQRIAALALADLRGERLEEGTDRQRDKWRQHYAALDALIELNS